MYHLLLDLNSRAGCLIMMLLALAVRLLPMNPAVPAELASCGAVNCQMRIFTARVKLVTAWTLIHRQQCGRQNAVNELDC
jgi:hypothetical protein